MLDSILFYAALVVMFAGAVSVIAPLRFAGLRTRRSGAILLGAGLAVAAMALLLPISTKRAESRSVLLDIVTPVWQFDERHAIVVDASAAATMQAVKSVPADEIRFFGALTAIRRGGSSAQESIINPTPGAPLLDVALRTGFVRVMEAPGREIVIGCVIAAPRTANRQARLRPEVFFAKLPDGVVLATMNFIVRPLGPNRSLLTTETRVFANTPSLARRFAVYWRIIHPGSDIIRRMWLWAIKARAEKTGGQRP